MALARDACVLAALLTLGCAGSAPKMSEPSVPPQAASPPAATQSARAGSAETSARPTTRARPAGKGEQELERGIASYADGEYKTAAKQLESALELGLEAKSDQARAHKYLAFISCTSVRDKTCHDEFAKALDADPAFNLDPSEAGHPIWSVVLRNVKAERAGKSAPR